MVAHLDDVEIAFGIKRHVVRIRKLAGFGAMPAKSLEPLAGSVKNLDAVITPVGYVKSVIGADRQGTGVAELAGFVAVCAPHTDNIAIWGQPGNSFVRPEFG